MHDLVIRGGTIVDGLGAEPFTGDVAVTDGVITEVGRLFDVSVVTFPAYAGTDVALRSGLPTPPKISVPATARDQYTRIRQNLRKGPHR